MSQVDVPTEVQIYTHRHTLTLPTNFWAQKLQSRDP